MNNMNLILQTLLMLEESSERMEKAIQRIENQIEEINKIINVLMRK